MVDRFATVFQNTTSVSRPVAGIDTDGQRTSGLHVASHVGFLLRGSLTRHLRVAGDRHLEIRLVVDIAGASSALVTGVGVVSLRLDATSTLHVVVAPLGPAATAAIRHGVARHALLRGEDEGLGQQAGSIGLDLLGGGEGPAAAAVTWRIISFLFSYIRDIISQIQ